MSMEIKSGRMVYLGYGKYWRSDEIVGLNPIEEGRGPGRRTEVYVASRDLPMIASRSERTILQDVVMAPEEIFRMEEARAVVGDLVDAFRDLSPLLRRVLAHEGHFDVERWEERLQAFLTPPGEDDGHPPSQTDIFA